MQQPWTSRHALRTKGRSRTSIQLLERVAELDPDDQYGLSMMGWLAFLDSDFQRAADFYRRADEIEPFSTKINQLWGASLARLGQFKLSRNAFESCSSG